jgi:hypothetical protein
VPAAIVEGAQDPDTVFVAHNVAFEHLIVHHVATPKYGWPVIPVERYRCTMAMAAATALPFSLEKAADALELANRKDTTARELMTAMAKSRDGWSEEKLQQLYEYCKRDVAAERELYHRLPPLNPTELAVWVLDAEINARGFYVDRALAQAAREMASASRNGPCPIASRCGSARCSPAKAPPARAPCSCSCPSRT